MQKLIEDWLAVDVNPTTRAQITELAKDTVSKIGRASCRERV